VETKEIYRAIEAMLFASGEPVSVGRFVEVLELDEKAVITFCLQLADKYEDMGSGLEIVRIEDKFQLCTKAQYAPYIRAMLELRRNTPLSQAAMEVLAIVAYNEPVTRNLIEQVRGVDCAGVISSLLSKGLIEEKGRLDLPGRPMQYKTTDLFLRCFGMQSLAELPRLPGDTDDEQIEGQLSVDDVLLANAETDIQSDGYDDESGYDTEDISAESENADAGE